MALCEKHIDYYKKKNVVMAPNPLREFSRSSHAMKILTLKVKDMIKIFMLTNGRRYAVLTYGTD